MTKYAVKTHFIFAGTFFVTADTKAEARKLVGDNCGLVLGGKIHTCLTEDVMDWDFPIHPENVIKRVKNGGTV
jgi:hypothetical protein